MSIIIITALLIALGKKKEKKRKDLIRNISQNNPKMTTTFPFHIIFLYNEHFKPIFLITFGKHKTCRVKVIFLKVIKNWE